MKIKYIKRYHDFFLNRINILANQVRKLRKLLPREEYIKHQTVKLYGRLGRVIQDIIPENPNIPTYRLKGKLSFFKRFKMGLQRYRIIFCHSNKPPVIVYLYLNDEDHLRKDGSKNDPYYEFETLLKSGIFSSDPEDQAMQKWLYSDLKSTEIAQ